MSKKIVKLAKPLDLHGKKLTEVELKEPSGGLYLRLGEPRLTVFNASGSGYFVEQADAIKAYLESCVVHELGADLLNLLSLEDAQEVKEALFAFFGEAVARRSARKATHLSSASAS